MTVNLHYSGSQGTRFRFQKIDTCPQFPLYSMKGFACLRIIQVSNSFPYYFLLHEQSRKFLSPLFDTPGEMLYIGKVQIIKIILYTFLIYIVYLIIRFFRALSKVKKSPHPPRPVSGFMVKDEMCNTYLPKEDAIREIHQGKEYYFCSNECRQKFLQQKKPQ